MEGIVVFLFLFILMAFWIQTGLQAFMVDRTEDCCCKRRDLGCTVLWHVDV